MATAAPSRSQAAHFSSDAGRREHRRAERARELNRGRADAARPAVNQYASRPLRARPRSKRFVHTVKNVSGIAAASISPRPSGIGQALLRAARRSTPRTRRRPRARTRARRSARSGDSPRHDGAGDLEAGNIRCAWRRRILAQPLHDVGTIDARGRHANQHLTVARAGARRAERGAVRLDRRARRSRWRASRWEAGSMVLQRDGLERFRRQIVPRQPAAQAVEIGKQNTFVDVGLIELVADLPFEMRRARSTRATELGCAAAASDPCRRSGSTSTRTAQTG